MVNTLLMPAETTPRLPSTLPADLRNELAGCTVTAANPLGGGVWRVSFRFTETLGCEIDLDVGDIINGCVKVPIAKYATANDSLAGLLAIVSRDDRYWVMDAISQVARVYITADCRRVS